MNDCDATANALVKLKIHEQVMGRLYRTYAERFPEQVEFWSKLSGEEDQHAKWIGALQAQMRNAPTSLITKQFPVAAIEHSIAYVEKLIAKADGPEVTLVNAVSAALNLEQGLLENKYFEVFETDEAKIKRILVALQDETRSHYVLVQKVWQDVRRNAESTHPTGCSVRNRCR